MDRQTTCISTDRKGGTLGHTGRHRQTDRQTDRQTYEQAGRQIYRQTYRQTDIPTAQLTHGQTDRQTDTQKQAPHRKALFVFVLVGNVNEEGHNGGVPLHQLHHEVEAQMHTLTNQAFMPGGTAADQSVQ